MNDAPVFERQRAEPATLDIVVNRWIRNGGNTITALLAPAPELGRFIEETRFECSVLERPLDAPDSDRREVLKLEHRGAAQPPIVAGTFAAAVPFPEWTWFSAPVIPDTDATREALVAELRSFRELLDGRLLDAAVARVRRRDEDLALAHYEELAAAVTRSRREFEFMTAPGRGELQPLEPDALTLRLFGGGRLARIDRPNGTSPIFYRAPNPSITIYAPLIFCRDGAEWIIVR